MIKLRQAVIVEGKYDKIRLSNILDASIITTDGFGIFKNKEKRELIKMLSQKCGIVIITDSDSAGQQIRRHICSFVKSGNITNVYLPAIKGKERRKSVGGAEGLLGVEGTDDEIIENALIKSGLTLEKPMKKSRVVTNTDLYTLGISGRENSKVLRKKLCQRLSLPNLPTPTLLDAVNTLYSYEEFLQEVEKCKLEETEN